MRTSPWKSAYERGTSASVSPAYGDGVWKKQTSRPAALKRQPEVRGGSSSGALFWQTLGTASVAAAKGIMIVCVLYFVGASASAIATVAASIANVTISLCVTQVSDVVVGTEPIIVAGVVTVAVFSALFAYLSIDASAAPVVDRALGCAERGGR